MRKVKYDHNPKNDYDDGYNAGRRRARREISNSFLLGVIVGELIVALALVISDWI